MTFREFCQSVAEAEREDKAARRKWLRERRKERIAQAIEKFHEANRPTAIDGV